MQRYQKTSEYLTKQGRRTRAFKTQDRQRRRAASGVPSVHLYQRPCIAATMARDLDLDLPTARSGAHLSASPPNSSVVDCVGGTVESLVQQIVRHCPEYSSQL